MSECTYCDVDGPCSKNLTSSSVERDAERYRKLRGWMSSNVSEGWSKVEDLAAIACYMDWYHFDMVLDEMPECNVGLMYKRPPVSQS